MAHGPISADISLLVVVFVVVGVPPSAPTVLGGPSRCSSRNSQALEFLADLAGKREEDRAVVSSAASEGKEEGLNLIWTDKQMSRRFLHLAFRNPSGAYSLHRLDTSYLFYKSTAAAPTAAAVKNNGGNKQESSTDEDLRELASLLSPRFDFQPVRPSRYDNIIRGKNFFAPLGESKILCADGAGQTAVYDATSGSVQIMPRMNSPKGPMHVVLPMLRTASNGGQAESLYAMDMLRNRPQPFEVFSMAAGEEGLWQPLPRPPFLGEPGYEARCYRQKRSRVTR
ncbi:hypothetical protein ACP70R_016780 [Stipagrostis hirtigluma subsp. patula]